MDQPLLEDRVFQLLAEPRDCVGAAGGQVDETLFLRLELLELSREPCFGLLVGGEEHVDRFGD
ncbi:hypothetical protein [uncultured Microbacterium sp.]|uniref:hypothetical protein n=1 Tax=uncultured Microbacterium sp. TaxID=191216 RepID=UPI002627D2E2|nr:hypothetical protein [uncultured Microbacterium sp.]